MFKISPLPLAPFRPLFGLDDEALHARLARRVIADSDTGSPCRVSLVEARKGEPMILAQFVHQPAATPFRSSHAIYIRQDAVEARLAAEEIPALFRSRTLSLRGFDTEGMIVDADLVAGTEVEASLDRLLTVPDVDYVHIHYALLGCYAARADRA